jgi:hypothetical protein
MSKVLRFFERTRIFCRNNRIYSISDRFIPDIAERPRAVDLLSGSSKVLILEGLSARCGPLLNARCGPLLNSLCGPVAGRSSFGGFLSPNFFRKNAAIPI